ncbi:MAG: N-acetylmuramoyl-L-alanine amidase [Chloroflexi bacterium]|nr:N-acetylmuramoyl-L-alanine amidase [Chloroflexota bacterium]
MITPRASWNALPPDHSVKDEHGLFDPRTNPGGWQMYTEPLDQVLRTIVIHHSALAPTFGAAEIQRLHIEKRGFADIAYHFVIAADGKIFEGRSINVRGAHAEGANTGSVGVVALGNFEEAAPPEIQLRATRELIDHLRSSYPHITHLAGHCDFNQDSVCPGKHLYPLLKILAREASLLYGTGGYERPQY